MFLVRYHRYIRSISLPLTTLMVEYTITTTLKCQMKLRDSALCLNKTRLFLEIFQMFIVCQNNEELKIFNKIKYAILQTIGARIIIDVRIVKVSFYEQVNSNLVFRTSCNSFIFHCV